jgi:DNA ligase (NAD+)
VQLGGTTVSSASLHNFDQVQRLDVRVGDTVLVEKAGEIIPQVVQVVYDKRPRGRLAKKPIKPPSKCPVCGGPVGRDEGEVAVRCINAECPAQIRHRLEFFAGRDQMDIRNLGPEIIDQLVAEGKVRHFADLYRLGLEDLVGIEIGRHTREDGRVIIARMQEKSAGKLLKAIEASKSRGPARVLAALGIRHVGGRVAEVLAEHFGDIKAVAAASEDKLLEVEEIGPVIASSVHEFFHSVAGKETLRRLKAAGVKLSAPRRPRGTAPGALAGKTVVVTGTLTKFSRSEAEAAVKAAGGRATSSVSKNTDFVVVGTDPGSKADKAAKLGVETIDETEFLRRLGQAGKGKE